MSDLMCCATCAALRARSLSPRRATSANLDFHCHGIKRALARQHDLIMRRQPGETDQHRLHLRRKHIDATNNQHVVIAAGDPHDADMGAAAGARLVVEPRDVARAIADHRQRHFGQGGDDQLAGFPMGSGCNVSGSMISKRK